MIYNNLYYIFDAEGTIFFTDELNNESYNYALQLNNLNPIECESRITRQTIINRYPKIGKDLLNIIIDQKQKYFINNINKTSINYFLFDFINNINKDRLFIWTASNRNKIYHLFDNFNISYCFNKIIFSDKCNISKDLKKLCNTINCTYDQLLIFENDLFIAKQLKKRKINCILIYYLNKY